MDIIVYPNEHQAVVFCHFHKGLNATDIIAQGARV